MCGICGVYRDRGATRRELEAMCGALAHRGPDDEGYYVAGPVGLGHRRLSINDLSTGHQPLANADESVWIVFNGEIYNYPQLRRQLESAGHRFRTHTDTECIVHLYEDFGEDCVTRLEGMFAFAIWDARQRKLVLSRDHVGQKPRFYRAGEDGFAFASEMKGVLAADGVPRDLDLTALHHYLSLRFIPPPLTMLRGVKKLPPAHTLVVQDGRVTVRPFWKISFLEQPATGAPQLLDALAAQLNEAVRCHLISDVPVGAFLSGGMDSSTIVAMMARHTGGPFSTFSIGVQEQDFNELPYARMVAEQYRTRHVEEVVHADLVELLPKMIWHLDEPSDPIAACMFHSARLAARHVKVVLGGDGGDELFAGFDRYLGQIYVERYRLLPGVVRRRLIAPLLGQMRDSFTYKSLPAKLRWLHQLSLIDTPGHRYAEATCFTRFNHAQKALLFAPDAWQQLEGINSSDIIAAPYNDAPARTALDRMLYADFVTRLPEHTLMLTDRMNMAHGLEARSPFLDINLVRFMAGVPAHFKLHGRELKYILRRLSTRYLPREIYRRPKQGFMFPIAYWFQDRLYGLLERTLLDDHAATAALFERQYVRRLLAEHKANRIDHHVRLWMLLNVELWHRLYLGGQSVDDLRAFLSEARSPTPGSSHR